MEKSGAMRGKHGSNRTRLPLLMKNDSVKRRESDVALQNPKASSVGWSKDAPILAARCKGPLRKGPLRKSWTKWVELRKNSFDEIGWPEEK